MADDETIEQLVGRAGPPPLRIHHILAATTVAAVLLSVSHAIHRDDVMGVSRYIISASGIVYTLVTALACTLVLFGFWWRHEGRKFFDLPGHWLLLKQSVGVGIFVATAVSGTIRMSWGDAYHEAPLYAYIILINVVLIGLSFWAAWRIADSISWRLWFAFYGCQVPIIFLLAFAGQFSTVVLRSIPWILLLLLIAATIGDWTAHRTRDWPHWLGVFFQLSLLGSTIVLGF